MAKPKGEKPSIDLAEGALIDVPLEEMQNPELSAIEAVVTQYGDSRSVMRVHRQGPAGHRDLVFLFECTPSEWLAEGPSRLQRDYGKGTYRLHLHNDQGQMVINKSLQVEALPRQQLEKLTSTVPDTNSAIMAALGNIGESMKLMAQAIQATQHRDPLQGLQGLKEVAGIIKEIMPPVLNPGPMAQGMDNTLNLFRTVMEFSKTFAAPAVARDGDGNFDVQGLALTKGLDLVTKLFEQHMSGTALRPVVNAAPDANVQVLTQEQVAALPPSQSTAGEDMSISETLELQMLKLQLRHANRAAANGADPVAYAEGIEAMIPDEVFDMLETDPQWFEYIVKQAPECAQFKPWYEKLRAALLAMVTEEPPLTPPEKAPSIPAHGDPDGGTGDAGGRGPAAGNT